MATARDTDVATRTAPSRRRRAADLMRSLTITPAAAVGGLLWKVEPQAPFVAACVIGIVGTIVFAATVEERYAA